MQILYFDVESFIVYKLVKHEGNGSHLADQGRLCLYFQSDFFLLLVVQFELFFVLRFLHGNNIIQYKYKLIVWRFIGNSIKSEQV